MAVRKGDVAKEVATQKIIEAFGEGYCGTLDKKIYVNIAEGGEVVQLAISMTMPKAPVFADGGVAESISMNNGATEQVPAASPVELSEFDRTAIERLKEKLGVN